MTIGTSLLIGIVGEMERSELTYMNGRHERMQWIRWMNGRMDEMKESSNACMNEGMSDFSLTQWLSPSSDYRKSSVLAKAGKNFIPTFLNLDEGKCARNPGLNHRACSGQTKTSKSFNIFLTSIYQKHWTSAKAGLKLWQMLAFLLVLALQVTLLVLPQLQLS